MNPLKLLLPKYLARLKVIELELERLHRVEILTIKMVKLLDDGKVDYELLRELKKYLNE